MPRRLERLTLGLVGLGRIGRAVADRAKTFGLNVLATSRSAEKQDGAIRLLPLEALLREADVVSLHLPLNPQTRHIINRKRLSLLKKTAYLVNTSRGCLIDPVSLLEALDAGLLAGAALDVFEHEPPLPNDPLVNHPKVIAMPHVAFRSAEALIELRTRAAQQIADVLAGRVPEHVVNPEVFQSRDRQGAYPDRPNAS